MEDSTLPGRPTVQTFFSSSELERSTCYQLPRSTTSAIPMAQDQCCRTSIFQVDEVNKYCVATSAEVDITAFVPSGDASQRKRIELRVHSIINGSSSSGMSSSKHNNVDYQSPASSKRITSSNAFTLNYSNDVHRVKVLPLPWTDQYMEERDLGGISAAPLNNTAHLYEAIGLLLVVATVHEGVSTRSIILTRSSAYESFRITESIEIAGGKNDNLTHESSEQSRMREMGAHLVFTESDAEREDTNQSIQPLLLVATSSSSPIGSSAKQRVDVVAYQLACHACPIFRFYTGKKGVGYKSTRFHLQALKDAGRVKSLSIEAVSNSGDCAYTLAVLSSEQLQLVRLPPCSTWDGQLMPLQQVTTVLLAGCHPTHTLGDGVLIVPLDDSSEVEEPSKFHFAVVCQPRKFEISVTPAASSSDRISPRLSPGILDQSILSPISSRGQGELSVSEWSSNETRNAVMRARRDLKVSSIDYALQSPSPAKTTKVMASPRQPFDEPKPYPPIGKKKIQVITDLDVSESSLVTPTNEVLDLSGKWARKTLDDSFDTVGSALEGLGFLSGELPGQATPLAKRLLLPPTGKKVIISTPNKDKIIADGDISPDQLAHLVVVTLEPRYGSGKENPSFVTKTFVAPLPQSLASLDAVSIKMESSWMFEPQNQTSEKSSSTFMFSPSPAKNLTPSRVEWRRDRISKLILAAKPTSLESTHLIGFTLSDDGIVPSGLNESHDLQKMIGEYLNNTGTKLTVKSMSIDDLSFLEQGRLRLRVLFSSSDSDGNTIANRPPISISIVEDNRLVIATFSIPLQNSPDQRGSATMEWNDKDSVTGKLDAILTTLQNFESSVNRRLCDMEKAMIQNTNRIQRMEERLASEN